jgi:hypothetical protein
MAELKRDPSRNTAGLAAHPVYRREAPRTLVNGRTQPGLDNLANFNGSLLAGEAVF